MPGEQMPEGLTKVEIARLLGVARQDVDYHVSRRGWQPVSVGTRGRGRGTRYRVEDVLALAEEQLLESRGQAGQRLAAVEELLLRLNRQG